MRAQPTLPRRHCHRAVLLLRTFPPVLYNGLAAVASAEAVSGRSGEHWEAYRPACAGPKTQEAPAPSYTKQNTRPHSLNPRLSWWREPFWDRHMNAHHGKSGPVLDCSRTGSIPASQPAPLVSGITVGAPPRSSRGGVGWTGKRPLRDSRMGLAATLRLGSGVRD